MMSSIVIREVFIKICFRLRPCNAAEPDHIFIEYGGYHYD